MLMCLWLEPLFLVVTDRDTYTYGGVRVLALCLRLCFLACLAHWQALP
jgi:hypothetical protein